MANNNNETIGISAEFALCLLFNLSESLERHRIDLNITEQFIESSVVDVFIVENLLLTKHQGKNNGIVDFYGESDGNSKTVSLKTLMGKGDGKICPQGGQLTYRSFHKFIKNNIGYFLNKMQEQTFCCDYTLLISNCKGIPEPQILKNKNLDFTTINISYTYEDYQEKEREGQDNTEFSTNVFGDLNGERVKIGEFQFHFKKQNGGRNVVKFRFYKSFFM